LAKSSEFLRTKLLIFDPGLDEGQVLDPILAHITCCSRLSAFGYQGIYSSSW